MSYVEPHSVAARKGLVAGMVLKEINGVNINDLQDIDHNTITSI